MKTWCTLMAAGWAVVSMSAASPAEGMKVAAEAFLATLDAAERQLAVAPMDDGGRENFRYTPRERAGLCWKRMDERQRAAVTGLLKSALSDGGLTKTRQVMALEGVLAVLEKRPEFRDPEKYFVQVFGIPGDPKGWGWKFEGHHVSLNYTVVDGKVAVTPSFFGSNPGEVRQGPSQGLRVLADEEDVARSLARQLLADGVDRALWLGQDPPKEILTREQRRVKPLELAGLPVARMTPPQKQALERLIGVYLERHRPELAAADWEAIRADGIDQVAFFWSGSLEPGEAWYYRVQGPGFLLEAANSQNGANHVHAVWREFDGDFGRDWLGDHFRDGGH